MTLEQTQATKIRTRNKYQNQPIRLACSPKRTVWYVFTYLGLLCVAALQLPQRPKSSCYPSHPCLIPFIDSCRKDRPQQVKLIEIQKESDRSGSTAGREKVILILYRPVKRTYPQRCGPPSRPGISMRGPGSLARLTSVPLRPVHFSLLYTLVQPSTNMYPSSIPPFSENLFSRGSQVRAASGVPEALSICGRPVLPQPS